MIKEILDDTIKQLQYYVDHQQFLIDAEEFFKECEQKFKGDSDSDDITLRRAFTISFLDDLIWGINRPTKRQMQMVVWIDEFLSESSWRNKIHRIRDVNTIHYKEFLRWRPIFTNEAVK